VKEGSLNNSQGTYVSSQRRKEVRDQKRRFQGAKQRGPWISGSSGSRGSYGNRGDRWGSSGSGSDALNWRKSGDGKSTKKGEEVTSPEKILNAPTPVAAVESDLGAKKSLLPLLGAPVSVVVVDGGSVGEGGDEDMKKDGKRGTFKRLDKNKPVKGDGGKGEKI
jgi:hypothetical protein